MNLEHLRTPIQSTHFIEKINETLSRLDDQCLFPLTIFCIGAWFLDYYKTLLKKKNKI